MAHLVQASANPDVFKWARRMSGLEIEHAARKAQIKPERLEAWEAGDAQPTINQLRRLADIYKRSLAVFLLKKAPADEPLPSDYRRFTPESAPALSPELRLVVRSARARREALLEVYGDLMEKPPTLHLRATLADDPEKVGARIREAIGPRPAGNDPRHVFNAWSAAAERAGLLVPGFATAETGWIRSPSYAGHREKRTAIHEISAGGF